MKLYIPHSLPAERRIIIFVFGGSPFVFDPITSISPRRNNEPNSFCSALIFLILALKWQVEDGYKKEIRQGAVHRTDAKS